jgi:GNAT superfamily N-acetyltransferase
MIRNARQDEVQDLIDLYSNFSKVFESKGFELPPEHLKGKGLKKWIEESVLYHGVCEREGQVVGALFLDKVEEELFIHTISVRDEFQGQGVGRELFNTALLMAGKLNCRLCVESYEIFEAGAFYEKMGMIYEGKENTDGFPYLIYKMPLP